MKLKVREVQAANAGLQMVIASGKVPNKFYFQLGTFKRLSLNGVAEDFDALHKQALAEYGEPVYEETKDKDGATTRKPTGGTQILDAEKLKKFNEKISNALNHEVEIDDTKIPSIPLSVILVADSKSLELVSALSWMIEDDSAGMAPKAEAKE